MVLNPKGYKTRRARHIQGSSTRDIIVKVEAESTEKLKEMIAFKIRRLKDIRSTLTLTAVEGM